MTTENIFESVDLSVANQLRAKCNAPEDAGVTRYRKTASVFIYEISKGLCLYGRWSVNMRTGALKRLI